jgi:hypothetical protein
VDRPFRGRWYGKSGEAAHFERLQRCCLTSRSELAFHRLFVNIALDVRDVSNFWHSDAATEDGFRASAQLGDGEKRFVQLIERRGGQITIVFGGPLGKEQCME